MFSIRSILTAAVALATLASAIPLTPSPNAGDITNPAGSIAQILPVGALGSGTPALSPATPDVLGSPVPAKRDDKVKYPGDIFNSCHDGIAPLVAEIKVVIEDKNFDHGKVTDLVNKIIVIVKIAIADLKVTLAAKLTTELLLTVDGVVCTVAHIAVIVYGVLELVVVVVALVLRLVVTVDITLAVLLWSLGPLLCELVTLVISIVVGLDVELALLVDALFISNSKYCGHGFDQILVLLKIKA